MKKCLNQSSNDSYIPKQKKPKCTSAKPHTNNQLFNIEQEELYESISSDQNLYETPYSDVIEFAN